MTTYHEREIKESPKPQGKNERIIYNLLTTPWGGTPSSPVVAIYDESDTDLSATNLSGTATVSGEYVYTPMVISLTPGVRYRIDIRFTTGGNTEEAYLYLKGEE